MEGGIASTANRRTRFSRPKMFCWCRTSIRQAGLIPAIFIRQGFQSYLGLPLAAKDRVVGILSFYSRESRDYSDEEINFLRSLAR